MNEIEKYISTFPAETAALLTQMRESILRAAPGASESISYGMPAYKLHNKPLVYFAGYKNHIGFYATPQGHQEFARELSAYKQGKGSVQFPLNQPLPLQLVERITRFKAAQCAAQAPKTKK